MERVEEKLRLSDRQWAIATADAILIGRRDVVYRKLAGGPEFSQFLGELQAALAGGDMTPSALHGHFDGRFPPAFVDEALAHLRNFGIVESPPDDALLADAPAAPATAESAALDHHLGSAARRQRLRSSKVAIVGAGRLAERVVSGLGELGLERLHRLLPEGGGPVAPQAATVERWPTEDALSALLAADFDLVVATADDPIERLRAFPVVNRAMPRDAARPWLAAYVDGDRAYIGPLFVGGETGCYRCLELREENHLPHPTEFGVFKAALASPAFTCASNTPAPVVAAAGAIVTVEAMKVLARFGSPITHQALVVFDCNLLEIERHQLLKVPFCDVCGTHLTRAFQKTWDI